MNDRDTTTALLAALSYDPASGKFSWCENRLNYVRSGRPAGSIDRNGYERICFRKKNYLSHRLAWLFMTGTWPDKALDHKNTVKNDNRFSNLRLATGTENEANKRGQRLLPKGVARLPSGKYQAQIRAYSKWYYLGCFDTPEDASAAYGKRARELHGEFARQA